MANIPYPNNFDDDFINIFKEVITMMNKMGYTYEESLRRAHEILDEAQQTNDMNESVQQQINTLIAESGTSDAEVLQARIDAEGNEYPVLKDRLDESDAQLAETVQDYDVTVTVGTGGDYSTVNDAIGALSKKSVKYKKTGLKVEIKLLSGFVMAEQVYVENIDLGFITITSEDEEVIVDASSFDNNVSEPGYSTGGLLLESGAVFTGYGNAVLPVISVLFNLNKSGTVGRTHGITLIYGATGRIARKKGFKNGIAMGVAVFEGSRLYATDTIIKDNDGNNISCFRGAYVLCRGVIASGAGSYGIYLDNACIMDGAHSDFSNSGKSSIWASGISLASANYSILSDCIGSGITADSGSNITAHNANIDNAGQVSVSCNSAYVHITGASVRYSGITALVSTNGGKIDAQNADLTGATSYSAYANYGGIINITKAKAQKVEGVDGNDIRVAYGGFIFATEATGGLFGAEPNTFGSKNGVIISDKPAPDAGFIGGADARVTWGKENHGSVGSSTIPLQNANNKTITITRINLVEAGDLSSDEIEILSLSKSAVGFYLYCSNANLSAKLSQTNTSVYFTVS